MRRSIGPGARLRRRGAAPGGVIGQLGAWGGPVPSFAARIAPRGRLRPRANLGARHGATGSSLARRCANSRSNRGNNCSRSPLESLYTFAAVSGGGTAGISHADGLPVFGSSLTAPHQDLGFEELQPEVCKLSYDDATSTISMLDPPKERILELCLTQILPGEYAIARR